MTDKLFSHIGVATYKKKTKFKWTMGNVDARIKILEKNDFENIEFRALPSPMTKAQAYQTDIAKDLATRHSLKIPTAESQPSEESSVAEAA